MRSLDVDFAQRSEPPRWLWMGAAILALISAGLIAASIVTQQSVRGLERELAQARQRAEQERIVAPLPVQAPRPYDASARQVLREASSPWPQWLTALESIKVDGVQVVGVEIDASGGRARVEVQFTDMKVLLQYLEELNAGEPRVRWALDQARMNEGRISGSSTATLSIAADGERRL